MFKCCAQLSWAWKTFITLGLVYCLLLPILKFSCFIRCMSTPPCFSAIWTKGNNFHDFLFASQEDVTFPERVNSSRKNCPQQIYLIRVIPSNSHSIGVSLTLFEIRYDLTRDFSKYDKFHFCYCLTLKLCMQYLIILKKVLRPQVYRNLICNMGLHVHICSLIR